MLLSMLLNFYRDMRQRQARRAAIRHLAELDDYLLRDIGIERTDIERYVDGDTPSPSASASTRIRPSRMTPAPSSAPAAG
jgi:uncharacterized protein YjiS (DUF1127 family)